MRGKSVHLKRGEALGKQIINLVKVITEDELIRRTGKKNIVFKKTQK